MTLMIDYTDKTVVVIGGTSGINRGIAEMFAEHGASVAVASRNQDKVEDTVSRLKKFGVKAMGFSADVRDFDALAAGVNDLKINMGEFDAVISGAAGNFPAMANDLSPNGFKSVVDIDLRGTFHVMQAIFPHLKKPGASVINISAPQALIPMTGQIHVCAAKAGVDMITKTLALEWGSRGVRVNSIIPGPIDGTEGMARLAPTEEARQKTIRGVPLGRMGIPQDIGKACLFLCSELASYITGAIIPLDGAWAQNDCGGMGNYLANLLAVHKK